MERYQAHLVEQKGKFDPHSAGFPKGSGAYADIQLAMRYLLERVKATEDAADRENKFIYFQLVPNKQDLPDFPNEATIMIPKPFEPPKYTGTIVQFEYKTKPSFFSSLFGAGTGSENDKAKADNTKKDNANAEEVSGGSSAPPTAPQSSSAPFSYSSGINPNYSQTTGGSFNHPVESDEEMARRLQAQFNAEMQPPPQSR